MAAGDIHGEKPSAETHEMVDSIDEPSTQRLQVLSVGLNDALAKDRVSPWSWAMLRLYGIVALTTLSGFTFNDLSRTQSTHMR